VRRDLLKAKVRNSEYSGNLDKQEIKSRWRLASASYDLGNKYIN
jgi:hypothetical protein